MTYRVAWLLVLVVFSWLGQAATANGRMQDTAGQDYEKILGIHDSVAYRLLKESRWDRESPELLNCVRWVGRLPALTWHAVDKAAKGRTADEIDRDREGLGTITDRACEVTGQLVDVIPLAKTDTSETTITSPEQALELAEGWSDQNATVYLCVIRSDNSKSLGSESQPPQIGVLTTELPYWLKKKMGWIGTEEAGEFDRNSMPPFFVRCSGVAIDGNPDKPVTDMLSPRRYLIAHRLQWVARSADEVVRWAEVSQQQGDDWFQLASHGLDLGLFAPVLASQRQPLLATDTESFFKMLETVSALGVHPSPADSELPIRDSIQAPGTLTGNRYRFQMVIKQTIQVPMPEGERGQQLGIDQYYLLHGLVSLAKPIRLKREGMEDLYYERQFPVVLVSRQLPAGVPLGDSLRQWVTGSGWFFKAWSYESAKSQSQGTRQWSPLLMVDSLTLSQPPDGNVNPWPVGWLLMIPVGLGTAGLMLSGIFGWGKPKRRGPAK